jgi:EAL domain-containing protein (putative c-di-GMP-specific phosphodiesterase class I)
MIRKHNNTAMIVESDLQRGIEDGELILQYQPKISFRKQRIMGFEALVRWNHPLRGLLPPRDFIPLAEATGLIVPLGRFVLKEACRQMATWQETLHTGSLTIGVNTTSRYLAEPHLIRDVGRVLAETGLAPGCLRFEIAEGSIMANTEPAMSALQGLSAMRVGLEIDDFGIGPYSRSYLREIPFDALKIHNSFVKELGGPNDSSEIIRTILRFVGGLGMEVAAEGVEARYQLDKLTALGCRQGQGYYFSRPVDAEGARHLIQDEMLEEYSHSSIHLV